MTLFVDRRDFHIQPILHLSVFDAKGKEEVKVLCVSEKKRGVKKRTPFFLLCEIKSESKIYWTVLICLLLQIYIKGSCLAT